MARLRFWHQPDGHLCGDGIMSSCTVNKTCHSMMTSSNKNIFRVTGPLCGEFTGEFPSQRPVTRSFDAFSDLHGWINNREADDLRRYRGHYDVIVMHTEVPIYVSNLHWCHYKPYSIKIMLYNHKYFGLHKSPTNKFGASSTLIFHWEWEPTTMLCLVIQDYSNFSTKRVQNDIFLPCITMTS